MDPLSGLPTLGRPVLGREGTKQLPAAVRNTEAYRKCDAKTKLLAKKAEITHDGMMEQCCYLYAAVAGVSFQSDCFGCI